MDSRSAPLDERKQAILRAIVEAYVRDGEPVGSKAVADDPVLQVSSATIRNEMGILEREGYIAQPHTSAGRVPTDKGYRYYVDALMRRPPAPPQQAQEIERHLFHALSALDDLLERATTLLSDLTDYTALVAAPAMTELRIRWMQLVPLGGRRAFLVVVGEGAQHEERLIELPVELTEDLAARTLDLANRVVGGCTPGEAADRLDRHGDGDEAKLLRALGKGLRHIGRTSGRVFTGGASRMVAWEPASMAQRVLEAIEGGEVAPLLAERQSEGVDVRIGHELALEDIHDLSLIAAGYQLGKNVAGTLGVLGPTRMDYPNVMATVELVARSVSRVLRRLESS